MPYNRNNTNMSRAYQAASSEKDSYGASGPSIIKAPAGVKFFKFDLSKANQEQYFNIIPWAVETANHPGVAKNLIKIGENDFYLDIWTHRVEGAVKGNTICMSRTYGRPCPYEQEMDGQEVKASRRSIFWVQECDRTGAPIGDPAPKLFIVAHSCFTKTLLEEADIQGKSMGFQGSVPFADPTESGFVVAYRFRQEAAGNNIKYAEVNRVDFLQRRVPISAQILDTIPALDTLLVLPTREEIHKALYGEAETSNDVPSGEDTYAGASANSDVF